MTQLSKLLCATFFCAYYVDEGHNSVLAVWLSLYVHQAPLLLTTVFFSLLFINKQNMA